MTAKEQFEYRKKRLDALEPDKGVKIDTRNIQRDADRAAKEVADALDRAFKKYFK